jgi:hypothetical protein
MQQRVDRLDDLILGPIQAAVWDRLERTLPETSSMMERAALFVCLSALWGLVLYSALEVMS